MRGGVLEYIVFLFACEVLFFVKFFVDGYLYRSFPIKKHSPFLSHKTTERFPEPLPCPNIAVRLLDTVAAEGIGDCSKTHHKSRGWPFQKWYGIRKDSKKIIYSAFLESTYLYILDPSLFLKHLSIPLGGRLLCGD